MFYHKRLCSDPSLCDSYSFICITAPPLHLRNNLINTRHGLSSILYYFLGTLFLYILLRLSLLYSDPCVSNATSLYSDSTPVSRSSLSFIFWESGVTPYPLGVPHEALFPSTASSAAAIIRDATLMLFW